MAEPNVEKPWLNDLVTVESRGPGETQTEDDLHREFKPRQVFMFSIACAIGTGLIIGSGTALSRGGPGSLLIAYILVGLAVFFVMTALGEMAAFLPMKKGFGGYATRLVDPALGYATGWNYFLSYILAAPTNLTAAGLIIQYWRPDLNVAIWITVFAAFVITINLLHVNSLGETEFWLGLAKVTVLVILIFSCFIISLGGGPNHVRTGFYFWQEPGAFAAYLLDGQKGYFLGWWACMCQACFTYAGVEVVGMTFGETPNPRKNVPIAVKQTFWRITSFYVIGVLVLGMAVPYNNDKLVGATQSSTSGAASPFVVALSLAGIGAFPDIINAALLIFVVSGATSDIYCASRSLYGLAKDGQAPKIFGKTMKNGIPAFAVALSAAFIALGYLNASTSSSVVFNYFTSLATPFIVLNWTAILICHIGFRRGLRAQGIALSDLPYVGYFQPYGSYYALFIAILVVIFNGYNAFIPHFQVDAFILQYLGIVIFVFNVVFWKFFKKTKRVTPTDMDLVTGRREYEEQETAQDSEWNQGFWKTMFKWSRKD